MTNIDERIWSEINDYPTATERLFRSREQTLIGDEGHFERVINEEFTKQLDVGLEFVQSSASGSAFPFNTGPESDRSTSNSSAIPLNQELNEMPVKNRANDHLYKMAQDADSRSLRSTPARNATANKGVLNQIKTSPGLKKRRSGSKSKRDRSKDDWHSIITTDGRENGRYLVLKINAYHKWKRLADRYQEEWLNQRSKQEGIVSELKTTTDPARRKTLIKENKELIETIAKIRASRNKKIRKLHQRWTIFMTFDLDFAKKHLGSPTQYPMTSQTRRSITDHTHMMQTGSQDDIELAEFRIQKFYKDYPEYNKTRRLIKEQSGAEPSDNQTTDEDESELDDTEIEEELEEENEDENDIRDWSKSPNLSFSKWYQRDNENKTAIERTTQSDQTAHSEIKADSDSEEDEEL